MKTIEEMESEIKRQNELSKKAKEDENDQAVLWSSIVVATLIWVLGLED